MKITEKIKEWQDSHIDRLCSMEEINESNKELELVLFAVDKLTDIKPSKLTGKQAIEIIERRINNIKAYVTPVGDGFNVFCENDEFATKQTYLTNEQMNERFISILCDEFETAFNDKIKESK